MRLLPSLALLGLVACADPVDQAAKKRIFSPEDPPQAIAAASEKLPPEEAADSVRISRRILGMGAAEAVQRLGPHRYTATITWEWNGGGKTVRLKESRDLQSAAGGVGGDFFAKLTNTNDMGLEVMRVKGQVLARSTYGAQGGGRFRERRRDRGTAERMREEAYGAVRDFDDIFRGRLKLTAQGTASVEGRTAWKYTVSLAPAAVEGALRLPALAVAKNGADETTARRLLFYRGRAPRTLQGEVMVDAQTSVVLRTKLDGRLGVASDGGLDAELRLVLDSQVADIGKSPTLELPKDFLADEDKPQGIAAALERFGVERKIDADGGVPQKKGKGTGKPGEEPPEEGE